MTRMTPFHVAQWRRLYILAALSLAGCASDAGNVFVADVQKNLAAQGWFSDGKKSVDEVGLRNILPQFDPYKPIGEQWPHVAVTVLKSPPMWGDLGFDPTTRQWSVGCFTLRAVVWSGPKTSRTIGPFDWCMPRDVEVKPGMGGSLEVEFNAIVRPVDISHMTGIQRTEGPKPPASLAPNDRATMELLARNNPRGRTLDLSRDNITRFGTMFWNLRHSMGATLTEQDFRVWIVRIEG